VLISCPGQKGHEPSWSGEAAAGIALLKSCGRLARSLAIITHALVVTSCLMTDMGVATPFGANNSRSSDTYGLAVTADAVEGTIVIGSHAG
jgi:hypothetical protein